jgi:electron transfer flavoprotein-quinone oxidoreductase
VNNLTDYDAVVVGAGPAGAAAALHMATAGLRVALLERGDFPGSKNMFGGTIYAEPTAHIVPEFWREAPLERAVTRESLWLLDRDSAVELGFSGLRFAQAPYNKFTAMRPKFDRWLAGKAAAAGAVLQTKCVVSDLHYGREKPGRGPVCGVVLDGGERITADVVVLAEGVTASLSKKAGLARPDPPERLSLYVREVIALPAEKIEERFNLEKDEGAIVAMLGYPTGQAIGLAGIFTNRESLSLTLGMSLSKIVQNRVSLPELLARLKEHPLVRRLLDGGKIEGYAAHMIPEGGITAMPRLYGDGVMVAGDAAMTISGRRGADLAMLSGKTAAETAVQAKARQDFSGRMLKNYRHKLDATFFMKEIKQSADKPRYYNRYGDADYLMTTTANSLAYCFFSMGMDTEKEKLQKMAGIVLKKQLPLKSLHDLFAGLRNWGVM